MYLMTDDSLVEDLFSFMLVTVNQKERKKRVQYADNRVIKLHLQELGLTFLPEQLANFHNLHYLNIAWNSLIYLPEYLFTLQNLRVLNMSRNGIDFLSYSIDLLIYLEELNVGYNKLSALPASIGLLSNLQILRINNNKIVQLPNEIIRLNLKLFDFSDNPILFTPRQKQWLKELLRNGATVLGMSFPFTKEMSVQERLTEMSKRNQANFSSDSTDTPNSTKSSNI